MIGDVGSRNGQTQNNDGGGPVDGTSGILRVTQEGQPVGEGILGDTIPLRLYFAYGIRNSFPIDFDPITGTLSDTENGANDKDEINLVKPGFNSGWSQVTGFPPKRRRDHDGPDHAVAYWASSAAAGRPASRTEDDLQAPHDREPALRPADRRGAGCSPSSSPPSRRCSGSSTRSRSTSSQWGICLLGPIVFIVVRGAWQAGRARRRRSPSVGVPAGELRARRARDVRRSSLRRGRQPT